MKRTSSLGLIIPIFVIIVMCFTQCKREGVFSQLQADVKEKNKDLPEIWDDISFLDSMAFIPPSTIKSYYSIRGMSIDLFHKIGYDSILYNFTLYTTQTEEDIRDANKKNIIFTHTYLDPDGNLLCEFSFSPKDYYTSIRPKRPSVDFYSKLSDEDTYELLKDAAKNLNYQIEFYPSEFLSLTKVEAKENILIYTLIAKGKEMIELKKMSADEQKKMVIDSFKEDDALYYANIIFRFIFKDKQNNIICSIDIPASEFR